MSKYKAILFDMDGTLVPMDTMEFSTGYFKGLCKRLAHHGIPSEEIVKCIWIGTKAMIKNDGTRTNEEVFWDTFSNIIGKGKEELNPDCLAFYGNEFKDAIIYTQPNPLAKEAVDIAHTKAELVILATNPLFPMAGQVTRMGYVGLEPSDFALVTSYEKERFCKPNPKFYEEILKRMNLKPEECLMVGNDEYEDAWSCSTLGIDCYLVTDCLIPSDKYHHDGPRGSFTELVEYLNNL